MLAQAEIAEFLLDTTFFLFSFFLVIADLGLSLQCVAPELT